MSDFHDTIKDYRRTYFRVHEILKSRTEFFRPLNEAEMKAGIRFANRYYDSRGMSVEEISEVTMASVAFAEMKVVHPEITGCDPRCPETAFTISANIGEGEKGVLTEAWLGANENAPPPDFSESSADK